MYYIALNVLCTPFFLLLVFCWLILLSWLSPLLLLLVSFVATAPKPHTKKKNALAIINKYKKYYKVAIFLLICCETNIKPFDGWLTIATKG